MLRRPDSLTFWRECGLTSFSVQLSRLTVNFRTRSFPLPPLSHGQLYYEYQYGYQRNCNCCIYSVLFTAAWAPGSPLRSHVRWRCLAIDNCSAILSYWGQILCAKCSVRWPTGTGGRHGRGQGRRLGRGHGRRRGRRLASSMARVRITRGAAPADRCVGRS